MIDAQNLVYSIHGRRLTDNVSLTLPGGEIVAILGPNGAGKSTLLRQLTGYLKPDSGRCTLLGKPLPEWPLTELAKTRAVMRQNSHMAFPFSVREVIRMGRHPHRTHNPRDETEHIMALCDCSQLASRDYRQLSGGEQQRVQLARALAQLWCDGSPRGWLFLDEPTSALDLFHQQHLLRLLKTLTRKGHLHVCIVLHDLNLAALWADRIVLLHGGNIVAEGAPAEVLQADTLTRWYGAEVHVGTHPTSGGPQIFLAP